MSDWQPDLERLAIDLRNEAAQTSSAQKVWVYIDISNVVGDVGHSQVCASLQLAKAWLAENDPTGAAFEYSLIDRRKE